MHRCGRARLRSLSSTMHATLVDIQYGHTSCVITVRRLLNALVLTREWN